MNILEVAAQRIERSLMLERVASPVQDLARSITGAGRWRDLLSGRGLGHPAHPALVGIPAGAWTSALIMDMAGQPQAARKLIGVGTVSVVPAMLTGLSDWVDTEGAEQRIGLVHLSLNLVATAAYAASWFARRGPTPRSGTRRSGVALSVIGATTASAAAWLGGHMAYGEGVGVDTNAFETGPAEWTDAGSPPEVGGSSEVRRADGVRIVVVERSGSVLAMADRCSHRGGPLSDGEVADGCLACPWHGSQFDVETGVVRKGPATVAQPTYETRVVAGRLEVRRQEVRALRNNSVR